MNRTVLAFSFFMLLYTSLHADEDITILGLFKDRVIFKFNGRQYAMSPGESVIDGISLVSADSQVAVFDINGQQMRYALGGHIGSTYNESRPRQTVTIAPDSRGMYFINGSINKLHARFVVDTGATLISMNKHEAVRFGIDYKLTGKPALTTTTSGTEAVYLVTLQSVKVGDIELTHVNAAVHDSDYPDVILLGNSFLNQVSIQRDGQMMHLIDR